MHKQQLATIVTYSALGAAAAVAIALPGSIRTSVARPAPPPPAPAENVDLPAVIRDFRRDHPDFDVIPSAGYGHYAGNIGEEIGASGRPVFGDGPGAQRKLLLVTPNAASLTAQDSAKRAMFQGWGMLVTPFTANSTQAQYDAAVATVDVVYVSEEVTETDVSTKLRSAPIGVVCEDRPLNTQMGFSSSGADVNATTIQIADNTHEITTGFSLGNLAITSAIQPLRRASGTLAGGLTALAVQPATTNRMLAVIDKGGALQGGGSAAGRRVHLPWGGNTFNVNTLTADGRTLMRRAIDWAAAPSSIKGGKVTTQWRQHESRPIPPHLAVTIALGTPDVLIATAPTLSDDPVLDSWDSGIGPYGGGNVGPAPNLITGSSMPSVSEPTGMPPKIGEWKRDTAGTTTIIADIHCDKFLISNGHRVRIQGNLRICVHEEFKLQNSAVLELLPDSSLDLYVHNVATIQDMSQMNMNTWDPSRLRIFNLGTEPFICQNSSDIVGNLVSPNALLHLQDVGHFYGTVTARSLHIQNGAGLHVDAKGPPPARMCDVTYNDTVGVRSGTSSGGITSADSFDEWFNDVPGVNLSMPYTLTLVPNASGVYQYLNDNFHPIDDQLLTNEGDAHNNYFTMRFAADFTFNACKGQFFEFFGTDDVWVFIDGRLVMDIGGVIPGTEQYLEVDRLGLVDGEVYPLEFYYAQRQGSQAIFRLRTNLPFIVPEEPVVVSGSFD
jgi:fibro-slime domain-containing protein